MVFMNHFQKRMQPHEEIHGILCFQKYISEVYIYIIIYIHIIIDIYTMSACFMVKQCKTHGKTQHFFDGLKVDMHHIQGTTGQRNSTVLMGITWDFRNLMGI